MLVDLKWQMYTLELMKYYLAIKVSLNAVRNIYKNRNLSIL